MLRKSIHRRHEALSTATSPLTPDGRSRATASLVLQLDAEAGRHESELTTMCLVVVDCERQQPSVQEAVPLLRGKWNQRSESNR